MTDLYAIASAALTDGQRRIEAVALNAAHSATPGYRRQVSFAQPFASHLLGPDATGTATGARDTVHLDLKAGSLMSTGRTLDFAVEGDGLFFGLSDGVKTWLTRAGSFRLDDQGVLIGANDLRVAGVDGDIRLPGGDVEVSSDGRITHYGAVIGALQLFRLDDASLARAASGALIDAGDGHRAVEAGDGRVRNRFLESANTDSTADMLGLMAISRQVESLVRVTQNYDELLGRTIEKLGGV